MINKKVSIVIFIAAFLISFSVAYSFVKNGSVGGMISPLIQYKPPSSNGNGNVSEVANNEPKTEECPINGQMYGKTQKAKWETRRPLGIMVENHTDARPQSGLSSADVIYEAVAEGGITRFLTIFYCEDANPVGPVRSARVYFLRLLEGYGDYPLYAHVGGANTEGPADALGEIDQLGWGSYNDLNQFAVPFPYYWRDYERLPNVATEHTVYTATAKLWDYAKTKRKLTNVDDQGKSWDATFQPWKFKDDAQSSDRGTVGKISFGFWNMFASDYSVTWTYDKVSNSYKRANGGSPHIDKNTAKQLTAKDVVIVFSIESPANDGYPGGHILYKVIGSGNALVFQDGNVIKGTWAKRDETSAMKFYDENGKEVQLVRGKIFVEILPTGNKVTY